MSNIKINQSSSNSVLKGAESFHIQTQNQDFTKILNTNHQGGAFEKGLTDLAKGQVDHFIQQAHFVEGKVQEYARGDENIENVTPLVSQLAVEVEAFKSIIDALTGVPKTLLNIQI